MPTFYARFNSSSDIVKSKFLSTDFEKQNQMLIKSLRLVAGVSNNEVDALAELRKRAETHDRHHLNITADLYEHWHKALVSTAADVDPQWDEELKRAWDSILDNVTNHMVKHY